MDKYSKLVVGIKVDIQRTDGRSYSVSRIFATSFCPSPRLNFFNVDP